MTDKNGHEIEPGDWLLFPAPGEFTRSLIGRVVQLPSADTRDRGIVLGRARVQTAGELEEHPFRADDAEVVLRASGLWPRRVS